jgi:predicted ester cyclase
VAKDAEQVGLDGFKQRIAGHHAGVSDLRMTIHDLVVEGNLVALRWSFQGTHDGTWLGRPATGRTFTLNGMNLERLDGNRIVEHWSYPDLLGLLRQLGLA